MVNSSVQFSFIPSSDRFEIQTVRLVTGCKRSWFWPSNQILHSFWFYVDFRMNIWQSKRFGPVVDLEYDLILFNLKDVSTGNADGIRKSRRVSE